MAQAHGAVIHRDEAVSGYDVSNGLVVVTTSRGRYSSDKLIVAAGAFNTPQLLMLSGIGPKTALEQLGIDVRQDLPGVGKNLQDHLHTRVRCEITQPLTFAPLPDELKAAALREYEANRSGALGSKIPTR